MSADSCEEIVADVLKQELGTRGNTLSFWKCEDERQLKDTFKAILLSTTSIDTSQFIIIDEGLIEKYNIDLDDTEEGKTGYKGFEKLHINFCNLNYGKIGDILEMYREASEEKDNMPELKREQVKKYIIEVKDAGLLNEQLLNEQLKTAIDRYCKSA